MFRARVTRRQALALVGLGATGAFLAACGGAAPATQGAPTSAPGKPTEATKAAGTQPQAAEPAKAAAGETKLVYWTFMPTKPRFEDRPALFEEFGKPHSAVIEVDDVSDFDKKLPPAYAAGITPDLIDPTAPQPVQWAQQGFLVPVDDLVGQIGKDDFPPVALDFATWEGKVYGLPLLGYPHVMHYHSDWLQEEGLQVPTTHDELIMAAKKLTGTTKEGQPRAGISAYMGNAGHSAVFFQNFVGPNEGYTFDKEGKTVVDSPEVFQAMKAVNTLVPHFEPGYKNLVYDETRNLFAERKIAIEIDSTSMGVTIIRKMKTDPKIAETVKSTLIPWGPSSKKDRSGFNGIAYFAIGSKTKQLDLAKQFLSWFYSKPIFTRAFLSYDWGLIPERISVATDPEWLKKVPAPALAIIKAGSEAVKYATFPGQDWGPSPRANQVITHDTYRNLMFKIADAKSDDEIRGALQWAKQDIKQAIEQA